MNLPSLDGIIGKLEKHAELITVLGTGYAHEQEYGGGISEMFTYLTNLNTNPTGVHGVAWELMYDFNHPDFYFDKLLGKTANPHLYSTAFKFGAGLYILGELGFLTKYKTLAKKIATGGAIAAAIFQGSGPSDTGANPNQNRIDRQNLQAQNPTNYNLNTKIGGAF